MTNFSKCKNFNEVLDELNRMADNVLCVQKKESLGDKYILIGVNARGAEFITFLDRPVVDKEPDGYDKLVIYEEYEVIK